MGNCGKYDSDLLKYVFNFKASPRTGLEIFL